MSSHHFSHYFTTGEQCIIKISHSTVFAFPGHQQDVPTPGDTFYIRVLLEFLAQNIFCLNYPEYHL